MNESENGGSVERSVCEDFNRIAERSPEILRPTLYHRVIMDELNDLSAGASILEVGCGVGTLAVGLAEQFEAVVAVDGSAEVISVAKKRYVKDNLRFVVGDSREIERRFRGQKFDAVVSQFMLHDYEDPIAHINIWQNLVREGGRIVILDRYWERARALRSLSGLYFTWWMWKEMRRQGVEPRDCIKFIIRDLIAWNSAEWREHRRQERPRPVDEWLDMLRGTKALRRFQAVNRRAFVAVLCY